MVNQDAEADCFRVSSREFTRQNPAVGDADGEDVAVVVSGALFADSLRAVGAALAVVAEADVAAVEYSIGCAAGHVVAVARRHRK